MAWTIEARSPGKGRTAYKLLPPRGSAYFDEADMNARQRWLSTCSQKGTCSAFQKVAASIKVQPWRHPSVHHAPRVKSPPSLRSETLTGRTYVTRNIVKALVIEVTEERGRLRDGR